MQYAHWPVKCQMHSGALYLAFMQTPNERLRQARKDAGYTEAKAAAKAMGVPYGTYAGHENSNRGYPWKRALQYAKFFRTTPEWLLYGRTPLATEPNLDELEAMVHASLSELVTFETRLADLPRIVAPALHEQLARFRADRDTAQNHSAEKSPGKAARSQRPTKPT